MKTLRRVTALLLGAWTWLPGATPPAPVRLVFDTDMGNEVDDVLALGLIHALQTRGACELVAVTLTHPDPMAARYVDAVNTFYGRGEILIGVNPDAPKMGPIKFLRVAEPRDAAGKAVFPHDIDPSTAPRALALLRRPLAGADDGSVVLVQVGYFTNLVQLIESAPDEISPLAGRELVTRKVRLLSAMAGAFQTVDGNNHIIEYNMRCDIPAARKRAEQWPTSILWSDWKIGLAIKLPAMAVERDFGRGRHPVPEAYQLYKPTPHERPCWDPSSVLAVVYPDRGYLGVSARGRVTIEADGFTRFTPAKESQPGRNQFVLADREQAARARELLAALVTQPSHLP